MHLRAALLTVIIRPRIAPDWRTLPLLLVNRIVIAFVAFIFLFPLTVAATPLYAILGLLLNLNPIVIGSILTLLPTTAIALLALFLALFRAPFLALFLALLLALILPLLALRSAGIIVL